MSPYALLIHSQLWSVMSTLSPNKTSKHLQSNTCTHNKYCTCRENAVSDCEGEFFFFINYYIAVCGKVLKHLKL